MKIDDIVKNHAPRLQPLPTDRADFAFLVERLRAAGYDWPGCQDLLGTALVIPAEFPGYAWRCRREDSPRARMARLWLLGERLPRREVEDVLSASGVETLLERRILRPDGDEIAARVDLFPCEGAYVFTDRSSSVVRFKDHVYDLGSDSYGQARMTPRRTVRRALDLCTGSGLHAILAARHAGHAVGVDVSPRALGFSRVNAALNGLDNTRFVEGDLYGAVAGEKFDLITANPPWIAAPTPDMELCRWGGETGETITRRIVEGLPAHLEVGGTLAMVVIYPIMREQRYLDRFRSWLPAGGFGVALAEGRETTLESFVRFHLEVRGDWEAYMRSCAAWLDGYARNDIEAMGMGMAYVRRLPEGRPGWAVTRPLGLARENVAPLVESWLDGLERYLDPAWAPDWEGWHPALSDRIGRVWRDLHGGEGRAEFRSASWGEPVSLSPDEMRLVEKLGRGVSAGELAALLEWPRERARDVLAALGARELL